MIFALIVLPAYLTLLALFKMLEHDNIREARFYITIGYYCILFALWYMIMPFVFMVEDLIGEK